MKKFLLQPWIYVIIFACGLFFKVYQLDYKFFWFDEMFTVLHTYGFQIEKPPVDEIWNIQEYHRMLRPEADKFSLSSQLAGQLRTPNLNPLHYICLAFWTGIFGNELVSYRWYNVFVFLLTLPVLFLLTRKLFRSQIAGWISISLYACAPFINFLTHEARYHITWAFLLILVNYLLLKALEDKKILWWILYSLAGMLALYASILSRLVIIGHLVYVLIFHRKSLVPVFISSVVMLVAPAVDFR